MKRHKNSRKQSLDDYDDSLDFVLNSISTTPPPTAGTEEQNSISVHDTDQAFADKLYELIKKSNKPLQLDSILRMTHLARKHKKRIEHALTDLVEHGKLIRHKGAWSLASKLIQVTGTLQVQRSGAAFVIPELRGTMDVYIAPSNLGGALHGDKVSVLILPKKRGANREGRIISILARTIQELPVIAVKRGKNQVWTCLPLTTKVQAVFQVDVSALHETVELEDVLIISNIKGGRAGLFSATAKASLQNEATATAQELIAKAVHGIPTEFPDDVLRMGQELPDAPSLSDMGQRKDLRKYSFVTIDGPTAKDFDDAIYVEPLPHGKEGYRLIVAIADVAHYVQSGSPLDLEALHRGNSYYFPLSAEPMLPRELSNGLCSLNPKVARLVMVADMQFSALGEMFNSNFYEAVIESKARLTYDQVKVALAEPRSIEAAELAPVLSMLHQADSLAKVIGEYKDKNGRLQFTLPEAEFTIDKEGCVQGIHPAERHFVHQLIEEFMVAANEAVAEYLGKKNVPFLYRSHPAPSPEKLTALFTFLARCEALPGITQLLLRKSKANQAIPTPRELQTILSEAAQTPMAYTISRMLLRSMMQAKYTLENEGHYGLGSSCYTHFTSPIRRYADLLAHRALKSTLRGKAEEVLLPGKLQSIADQINATERCAVEAERDIQKRMTLLFMQDKIGEVFDGVISGVSDFGIFIELPSVMVEGMVRLASLKSDYYELAPERQELRGRRTNKTYKLGQKVQVELTGCNLHELELTFMLCEDVSNKPSTKKHLAKAQLRSRGRKKR